MRGRSWAGSWSGGTARIRFGVGCDDGCVFGDEVPLWGGSGDAAEAEQPTLTASSAAALQRRGAPYGTAGLAAGTVTRTMRLPMA